MVMRDRKACRFAAATAALIWILATVAVPVCADEPAAKSEQKPALVVFPFHGADKTLGAKIGDSLRLKFVRSESFAVIDPISMAEVTDTDTAAAPKMTDTPVRVAKILAESFAAQVAVFGQAAKRGERYTLTVRCVDLRKSKTKFIMDRTFEAKDVRHVPFAIRSIVEAISGAMLRRPGEVGDDPPPPAKLGPLVNRNPGFENGEGDDAPVGWDRMDGLCSFWVKGESPTGKCLLLETDVLDSQWLAWRKKWEKGARAKAAPTPLPTKPPKFDTVAGLHGAHVYSHWYKVKPGMRYRLSLDMKGKSAGMFFPKVWVKAYGEFPTKFGFKTQRREVYRAYLACRNKGEWTHYTRLMHPTRQWDDPDPKRNPDTPSPKINPDQKQTPYPKWMRVYIYAYWPPGKYYFDNVELREEPVKKK